MTWDENLQRNFSLTSYLLGCSIIGIAAVRSISVKTIWLATGLLSLLYLLKKGEEQ